MRALSLLPILSLLACGHRDGIIGVQPLATAGAANLAGAGGAGAEGGSAGGGNEAGTSGEAGAAGAAGSSPTLGFFDDFADNSGIWEELPKVAGASTTIGVPGAAGRDGRLAELRFPGNPAFGSTDQVGAKFGPEIDSTERFHFGTYRTRLGFGECAAGEETVMAFLGYFNDGQDRNSNGIVDEQLITVQMLCGTPSRLYLTVFTDYEETPSLRFRKLTRVVDFSNGQLAHTAASNSNTITPSGSDASLVLPDLFTPGALYELGFEWHADSVRFFIMHDGSEHELWTLTGAERVPQQPLHIVYHLWHPDTHWYPTETPADYPANDVTMRVDWVSFEPE